MWTRKYALGVSLLALTLLPGVAQGKPKYRVKVVRDGAGIAHVTGKDFRSLGYGEGYAYAKDNACVFLDNVVTVRGERTQFFGATGRSYYYSNGSVDPNPKSDAYWQWMAASGRPAQIAKGLSKPVASLYRGWVAGFDAYLARGKLRDPNCAGKPWVRPITMDDMARRGIQIQTSASSGNFISNLYDAQPPGTATTAAKRTGGAGALDVQALRSRTLGLAGDAELGSNGLAFGSQGTKAGDGLLLTNPHFPWRGIDRFWMAHLTVPGRYDVMGGTLGGFPLIGVGFNRSMAWTHTVSTGRRFVVMQLQLAPGDPTSYLVDGKPEAMTRTTVNVAGTPHTFYGTRYGLAFVLPQAKYSWTSSTAYALIDSNLANTDSANQYLAMGRARSVGRLLAVEQNTRAIPFFNTIAADSTGTALYADVGRYSNVPQSLIDQCTPSGVPKLVFAAARVITLDGSQSSCTPQGNLPASAMPTLLRKDYVENSNDSFWLANPKSPITHITPLIGLSGTIQGTRTRYANLTVQQTLAAGRRYTIPSLQGMWQSDSWYIAGLVSKQLATLCQANPQVQLKDGSTVDITAACPVLQTFQNTGNLDERGAWLFAAYLRRSPSGADYYSDAFDPANPLNTPNTLNAKNPAQIQALGAAVQELRSNNVPLDAGMRVQGATRGRQRIPIHGCGGCFQNINSSNGDPSFNAPYGEVVQGSSMVLFTELTKRGPKSQGILTYSQATDPTSRWYANMTKLFSAKRWVHLRFSAAAERRDKHRRSEKIPGAGAP